LNVADNPTEALEGEVIDDTSVEVAEGSNRVPATWLFCFSDSNLLFSNYALSEREDLEICTPFVTVKAAVENLKAAKARLSQLAGDETVASGYLHDALSALDGLPHKYLTIDYSELLGLYDEEEGLSLFANCYGLSDEALDNIKHASAFTDGIAPYSLDEFTSGDTTHVQRRENSAALYFGRTYFPTEDRPDRQDSHSPAPLSSGTKNETNRPWWKFWG